ncbi:hypothetical protein AB9P05_16740 [Roseivirga sp. BDSF3-8]|uniref:hypothetical protein n=1 Tax=Roseivirga sp. BDSF3-8 TaxID=3241598 RepID=UPI0035319856
MRQKMLEYSKMILSKVSFSRALFQKEYRKSLNILEKSEAEALREWVQQNYLHQKDLWYTADSSAESHIVA